jgi:hypothetical protein
MYHLANRVINHRPYDFGFNYENAVDNEFEHEGDLRDTALQEFEKSVEILRNEGIHVCVLEKPNPDDCIVTPDDVFPNNWLGTTVTGKMIVFTMAVEDRRAEARRVNDVVQLLDKDGFEFDHQPFFMPEATSKKDPKPEHVLEGTGALVFDHSDGIIYAAKSVRCHPVAVKHFLELGHRAFHEVVMFDTKSRHCKEIYHTNVVMSIGTQFAVICSECIVKNPDDPDCLPREKVLEKLRKDRKVIEISAEQAEKYFCANILELRGTHNAPKIVMSDSAYKGFTQKQRDELSQFGKLVALPISKGIEYVGGGSARCMLAEIYFPRKRGQ